MRRGKTEIVYGIMRYCERMEIDLSNSKIATRLDRFYTIAQCFRAALWFVVRYIEALTYVRFTSLSGNVDRAIDCTKQDAQATCVISVFMCNQNSVEELNILTHHCEATGDL